MSNNLLNDPRALLTALHQAAVQGANPFTRTQEAVRDWLIAANVPASAPIHMIAMGKAAATMAAGAAQALSQNGNRIAGGVVVPAALPNVNAVSEQGGQLPAVLEIRVGDHPVPGIGSLAAADVIARKVDDVNEGDIALVLISGGATSLCAAPCDELLEMYGHAMNGQVMLMHLVSALHRRGLAIHEMNAIRRRLLRWGGGRLAVALANQGASHIRVFSVSDVIGDDPSVIGSGPCSPDPMSEAEFLAMLDAYNLREDLESKVSVALGLQGQHANAILPPDPTNNAFTLVHYTIVARNQDSCQAMARAGREAGFTNITVVEAPITGEAETLGHTIGTIAIRAAALSRDSQLIIWGGEPTVTMSDGHMLHRLMGNEDSEGPLPDTLNVAAEGSRPRINMFGQDPNFEEGPEGGRMQALALAASLALEQSTVTNRSNQAERITILAAGTDGRDGPTDACGAVVNVSTPGKSRLRERDPIRDLHRLRSYPALNAAGDLLRTGSTGTNVMDVVAVYIASATLAE